MRLALGLNKGFTLIELLLVIAIMGIVFSSATPFYSRFLHQNSVSVAAFSLISYLRRAQFNAMMSINNSSWGVAYQSSKIVLFQGASYASRNPAFDEVFAVSPSVNISGLTEVVFQRKTGLPQTTPTITISSIGTTRVITINSQGVVGLQ